MHTSLSSAQRRARIKGLFVIPSLLVSLGAALLISILLFNPQISDQLISTIIGIGLDPLRAQFVSVLLLTSGIAFIGALIGRHKLGAILGAALAFGVSYLVGFVQLEQQPLHDLGGQLENLNMWALLHTLSMMSALAILTAFIGAAVGVALAEAVLDPLYQLAKLVWLRRVPSTIGQRKGNISLGTHPGTALVRSWLGAAVIIVLLIIASGSGDLFLFSPDVGLHSPPQLNAQGTIVADSVVSPALGGQRRSFLVYLPPSYNTSKGRLQRYPTLYLLHGSPGKDGDLFTGGKVDQSANTLIAQGKMLEMILISPDGNGRPGGASEWANSGDGKQLIETYVARDLVRYVDQKYRTLADPAYRGIGGLSMGGFGAMNIAIHHPDIFGFVISLGGYYYAEGSVWGGKKATLQANSPAFVLSHAKQAWRLHMFIGAATNDQPYYKDALKFAQELETLHITYHFDLQKGYHAWSVWQAQFYNALLWLQDILPEN